MLWLKKKASLHIYICMFAYVCVQVCSKFYLHKLYTHVNLCESDKTEKEFAHWLLLITLIFGIKIR